MAQILIINADMDIVRTGRNDHGLAVTETRELAVDDVDTWDARLDEGGRVYPDLNAIAAEHERQASDVSELGDGTLEALLEACVAELARRGSADAVGEVAAAYVARPPTAEDAAATTTEVQADPLAEFGRAVDRLVSDATAPEALNALTAAIDRFDLDLGDIVRAARSPDGHGVFVGTLREQFERVITCLPLDVAVALVDAAHERLAKEKAEELTRRGLDLGATT